MERKAMTDIEKRTGMTDAECEYQDLRLNL